MITIKIVIKQNGSQVDVAIAGEDFRETKNERKLQQLIFAALDAAGEEALEMFGPKTQLLSGDGIKKQVDQFIEGAEKEAKARRRSQP